MKLTEKLSLSSDKTSFDQATPPCQKVPDECGYRYTLHLHYEPPTTNSKKTDNGKIYSFRDESIVSLFFPLS